jgi:hypothetical protein
MPRLKHLCLLFVLAVPLQTAAGQQGYPSFENFRVNHMYSGKPARAKIIGRRARMFRTRIREGAANGPNFAGKYTVVRWGCGSDCQQLAIVNAMSGEVFFPPEILQIESCCFAGSDSLISEDTIQFKQDSRLLITVGLRFVGQKNEQLGKFYYEWRGNRLRLLRAIRRKTD